MYKITYKNAVNTFCAQYFATMAAVSFVYKIQLSFLDPTTGGQLKVVSVLSLS